LGNGIVDKAKLLDRVGESRELFEEVTGMYVDARPALLRQLESAVEAGDAEAVYRRAHRIKGTFGSLAADAAFRVAGRIVERARVGDLDGVRREFETLVAEAKQVEEELRRIDAEDWGEPRTAR
jgi:HPt (histidine-containing phosphotransfer) domain-containing protein